MSNGNEPRIVVVGASAAGLKAAARARRLLPGADITVLDERTFISYGACGLPFFLSGDVDDLDQLRRTNYGQIRDREYFAKFKGLTVRTGLRAVGLDVGRREIETEELAGGKRGSLGYDKLVIATGARPRIPAGVQLGPACTTFHTAEEAAALRQGLQTGKIGSVLIIGGGFIGVELAGAFADLWGCEVTIIEAAGSLLPELLDQEMAACVAGRLQRGGVAVRTGLPVTAARSEEGGAVVEAGGQTFRADRAVVAVGVQPQADWATAAGLAVGPRGGLQVDEGLRTSQVDIFAVGDCVEVRQLETGKPVLVPLGSLANRMGRVVGDNLAGRRSRFGPVACGSCLKIFDWNVAATGLTARRALAEGRQARTIWGTFTDVAHFYPEHHQIHLKLVYEAGSRRLIGLQAVGAGEVVKRVDLFTALLHQAGRLEDLLDQEICYSPPYNSALDPLFGLACAALNQEETGILGLNPLTEPEGRFVLDVRSPEEITAEYPSPDGAVNIPLPELRDRLAELPAGRPLLVVCAMGTRSAEATRWLAWHGFTDVVYLAGGVNMRVQA